MPSINLIEQIAKKYSIPTFIFCDFTHNIVSEYSIVKRVSTGFQGVDMKIVEFIEIRDIVITNDYGLASLCLSKKCFVINANGLEYTDFNIDIMLTNRYLNLKSKKKKGPKKRKEIDDINLVNTLENIINRKED